MCILTTVITVSVYCIWLINHQGGIATTGVDAYNPSGFWAAVGFSLYCYEGIGIVMPVMFKAKEPESFNRCLFAALAVLCVIYISFGELTALAWGANLTEPFVT